MNTPFWKSCKVSCLDHFAVTTKDIEATTRDYLSITGSKLVRGPSYNPAQNVDYSFVRLPSGETIEILGVRDGSPISEHIERGGGAYHLCFEVEDIEHSIDMALEQGAIMVVEPKEDTAFDGRRVCFLIHDRHGLFEFLESAPARLKIEAEQTIIPHIGFEEDIKIKERLLNVFQSVFVKLSDEEIYSAEYSVTTEWDSLKHLILVMKLEKEFEVKIDASDMNKFSSFVKCVEEMGEMVR